MKHAERTWSLPPANGELTGIWLNQIYRHEVFEQSGPALRGSLRLVCETPKGTEGIAARLPTLIRGLVKVGMISSGHQITELDIRVGKIPLGIKVGVSEL